MLPDALSLIAAESRFRVLGHTGVNVVTRILGILLGCARDSIHRGRSERTLDLKTSLWIGRGRATLILLTLASTTALAQDALKFRPSSFVSLSLPKAKSFAADFYVDNRDRDPHGTDVFDTGFRFRYQLGNWTEVFANVVADRVVALPETPAIPPSPRDLIFLGASRVIPNTFVGEHPYLDKRGDASFDAFIPGTIAVGLTRTLFNDVDSGRSTGVSAALVIPMAGSLNALRSGANSGTVDVALAGLGSTNLLGGKAHGRLGFTLAGSGSWPDRSFSVSGGSVQTLETDIGIGHRLDLGLAWIRPVRDSLAAAIEVRAIKEFTGDARIDAISPVDVTFGVHKVFGRFTLAASLLWHFRSLPSGATRDNPLAGAIDLSNVSVADRNAFLSGVGLGAAAGQIREGAHIVAIGVTSASLPAGATRIPATYNIRSEHNLGYVFNLTFRP